MTEELVCFEAHMVAGTALPPPPPPPPPAQATGRGGGFGGGGSVSVSVRYKETPRGPSDPMQAPGPNPCPALVTQGATNLPQVSPTTCSTQAELASNMYKPVPVHTQERVIRGQLGERGGGAVLLACNYSHAELWVHRSCGGPGLPC